MSQTKHKMPDYVRHGVVWLCRGYDDYLPFYKTGADDTHIKSRLVLAIDSAKLAIGNDLANEQLRQKLKSAIWESTLNSRTYPYEMWDLPTVCRDEFYERKREFIKNIAAFLGFL